MNKEVKITITGEVNTGRSTLAVIITEALIAAGLSNIKFVDPDFRDYESVRNFVKPTLTQRVEGLNSKNLTISVNQVQLPRMPVCQEEK